MTRIAPKLISALFVLGCGSGAMASPAHGQWTDSTEGTPTQTAPSPQNQGEDENIPPNTQSDGQGGYQAQSPSQNTDQDQDEDTVETQTWQTGQTRLGVMVMALTPELRRFFGITSDRGVLIARVEPGSAAARAGIQVGDVLTRVANQPVRTGDDVLQALAAHSGERIRVGVVRQGRMVRLFARLPGTRQSNDRDNDNDNDRI
ncbi:MAG TPA: PDZ domain-containing protein [Kofleriaceae bacterium]|jgi:membrane-associated protease RseP (regulator of RpoE activity)